MKISHLSLCVLALATSNAANATPQAQETTRACMETHMHLVQAQDSFGHIAQQEFRDSSVLVDLGYTTSYMSPQESITVYEERIKHLKTVAATLGCYSLKIASR